LTGESPKKLRKPPLILKHLNSKTVTIGYKLGDGTSGKVYQLHEPNSSLALKRIKLKVHKVVFVKSEDHHESKKKKK